MKKALEMAELNGHNPVDLVKEFFNCTEAEIDKEGDIWIANPQTGHWLREDEKEKLMSWLKNR